MKKNIDFHGILWCRVRKHGKYFFACSLRFFLPFFFYCLERLLVKRMECWSVFWTRFCVKYDESIVYVDAEQSTDFGVSCERFWNFNSFFNRFLLDSIFRDFTPQLNFSYIFHLAIKIPWKYFIFSQMNKIKHRFLQMTKDNKYFPT